MANTLDKIDLLSDLPAEELETLAKRCRWRRFDADEQVLAHLDAGSDLLFLTEGRLRVSLYSASGKEVSFEDLLAGQAFGELSAIDGKTRSASVFALQPSNVAFLSTADFTDLLRRNFTVAHKVMERLCRLVRQLDERVFEFSTLTVNNRIQAELLRLAGGDAGKQSAVIKPAPTHADIASRVSTHREAVTREMNALARAGVLKQERNALQILDLPKLTHMVHEVLGLETLEVV